MQARIGVPKDHVLSPLDLDILFDVLTNHLYLAVKSLSKLVDDYVCIGATKIVEKHWDLEADQALQGTLAVGSVIKPAGEMVVVSDVKTLRFSLF